MSTHRSNEPAAARLLRRWLAAMQSSALRVSWLGKAWRLVVMTPVFGAYLIIAQWRLWRGRPIDVVAPFDSGAVLRCRPPDLVMMYAHVFGIWEPDISRFLADRLKPGDTFIDIGANVGCETLLASTVVGDTGRIVAIEASPRIFQRLRDTIDLNGLSDVVRAVNVAAASAPGELVVRSGPEHNLGRTTTSTRSRFAPEATVPALPLHEILTDDEQRTARLVKIDVEGGEDEVLAGLVEFLDRAPDDVEIIVEITPRWMGGRSTPADVLEPLFERGFHAYRLPNNYWPWRYLWPNDVRRPRRVRFDLHRAVRQMDLVLSRIDAEEL